MSTERPIQEKRDITARLVNSVASLNSIVSFSVTGQQHISIGATENTSKDASRYRPQEYLQVSSSCLLFNFVRSKPTKVGTLYLAMHRS